MPQPIFYHGGPMAQPTLYHEGPMAQPIVYHGGSMVQPILYHGGLLTQPIFHQNDGLYHGVMGTCGSRGDTTRVGNSGSRVGFVSTRLTRLHKRV
jgi:hypothetical protein